MPEIHIVGGGLAGTEAAWQCLRKGFKVVLHEMRPVKSTPAHQTDMLSELVCSNSLKSETAGSAPAMLKDEMRALQSLILDCAEEARLPAGQALAVDRSVFSRAVTAKLHEEPNFSLIREEVTVIPTEQELVEREQAYIIATGPLTTDGLAKSLLELAGSPDRLYFYDAIAPVIAADSIDESACFFGSRYGKGGDDYLNIALNKDQYDAFVRAVADAEKVPLHNFEEAIYFECCLPIEVIIERGHDTLRFGPMKPVGFVDPKTGLRPWAVLQLRQENLEKTMYSIVGFQTKMKWPEQKRVFSMIPGLGDAEFLRFGSIHRNTYLQSPQVLKQNLAFKRNGRVFLAGQITGVEGYTESAAIGLMAGLACAAEMEERPVRLPPKGTMMGALLDYVTTGGLGKFQPMNANMGLLPAVPKTRGVAKADRRDRQANLARQVFDNYLAGI